MHVIQRAARCSTLCDPIGFAVPKSGGGVRYLPQGKGSGELSGGGTYVSFWDPGLNDLTIVIETAGLAVGAFCGGNCNGVCNYGPAAASQAATFVVSNLKIGATAKLALWRTRLGSENVTEDGLFEQLPDVALVAGKVNVVIDPDAIYTLSTVRTATKAGGGTSPRHIPASAPFPLPYSDDFESSTPPSPGKYWSDMEGGFEVATSKAPGQSRPASQVLRQTVAQRACCNFIPQLDGPLPLSIIGCGNLHRSSSVGPIPRAFRRLCRLAHAVPLCSGCTSRSCCSDGC